MSGHSHAKTVMATKMANAEKRGKIFSKYGRLITIAVKEGGGGDPAKNSKLKAAIEKAKEVNMPKENIERAIKRGTGELAGEALESVSYEGFGPGGFALIINGVTDNANRTLSEIKTILNKNGGKLAGEGAVRWMFEQRGIITIPLNEGGSKTREEIEAIAIESGADDIRQGENNLVNIYTKPEDFEVVKENLRAKGLKIDSAAIGLVPKEEIRLSDKDRIQAEKLFEALEENDAVNEIYSNIKN